MRRLAALLLVGVAGANAAAARPGGDTTGPKVTAVEAETLVRARKVLARFMANERHPECYRVLFFEQDGYLRVEFHPGGDAFVVLTEGEPPPKLRKLCGRDRGYLVNRHGDIVRKVYSRD
jgi:hypothetical protein